MEKFHFGNNLRKIREGKDTKQESLANEMNISQSKLSKIERKPYLPPNDLIHDLARHLKISPLELTPEWWGTELKMKVHDSKVRIITPTGIVFFIVCFLNLVVEVCTSIISASQPPTIGRVLLCTAALVGFGLLYYYSTKKIDKL